MRLEKTKHVFKRVHHYSKAPFWFLVGFLISALTISSITIIVFQNLYKEKTIPGVYIDSTYVGEKTKSEIKTIFDAKNDSIQNSTFTFTFEDQSATLSAEQLNIGYNSELIAEQATQMGKTSNFFANIFVILNSYFNSTTLDSSYTFDDTELNKAIQPMILEAYKEPKDALFTVENDRVVNFQQSTDGRKLDVSKIQQFVEDRIPELINSGAPSGYNYKIPTIALKPKVATEEVNDFGIIEEIGEGKSQFAHSIPNRVHNVGVAATKINGILVKPGEEFSFVKYLGDVSAATGYKQAYIISGGKTILGDGGGVCQVSTTLFRAILNAGLPITDRRAHAYRVSYYEQDSGPGLDATVYYPSVDLKFVNDTDNHILIQSFMDPVNLTLTYKLYGKKDGREVAVSKPIITSVSGAPEPLYQDDPTLPKGQTKQVDFAASGANVVFSRTVKKDGKVVIDEKFNSRYAPWRAVFLVGTKEG